MKLGKLVPYAVGVVSIGAVVAAFSSGASPYVTVAQARTMSGDRLHLQGELQKNSVRQDLKNGTLEFDLKDKDGATMHVVHKGERVSLSEATTIVAIGKPEGDAFVSQKLLVKCPSKYEEEGKGKVNK